MKMKKTLDDMLVELELEMAGGGRGMMPGEFFGEGYGHTAAQAFASFMSAPTMTLTLSGEERDDEYSTFVVEVEPPARDESIHIYRERIFSERQDMIDNKMALTFAYRRPARRPDKTPWVNKSGEPCWWIFGITAPKVTSARIN